jgi:hypothetical protein
MQWFKTEVEDLFTQAHAKRVTDMLKRMDWMVKCQYKGYEYTSADGTTIKEDIYIDKRTGDYEYTVLNPSDTFLLAHDGKPYIVDTYLDNEFVHTACMGERHDKFMTMWIDDINRFAKTDGYQQYFDLWDVILKVLGIKQGDAFDDGKPAAIKRVRESLKKIKENQLDHLEYLLTRSPTAYSKYKSRNVSSRAPKGVLVMRRAPSSERMSSNEFIFEPNEVFTLKFLKMLDANDASIDDDVTVQITCRDNVIKIINAFTANSPSPANKKHAVNQVMLFTGFRDADLETYVVKHGGTVKSSLTKTVTLVVVKTLSKTTAKVTEAKERGITITTVDHFKSINSIV